MLSKGRVLTHANIVKRKQEALEREQEALMRANNKAYMEGEWLPETNKALYTHAILALVE